MCARHTGTADRTCSRSLIDRSHGTPQHRSNGRSHAPLKYSRNPSGVDRPTAAAPSTFFEFPCEWFSLRNPTKSKRTVSTKREVNYAGSGTSMYGTLEPKQSNTAYEGTPNSWTTFYLQEARTHQYLHCGHAICFRLVNTNSVPFLSREIDATHTW